MWGSSFLAAIPPDSARPSLPPSFPHLVTCDHLTHTHLVTHSLTHSLTDSLTHSLTHSAGCLPRGRRSTQSLTAAWQAQYPEPPRRGCGAHCRRWCRWLSSWQAQCPEPPEGAAARVVAAGAAGCLRGRRSTQSLQKGLRRALSAVFLVAGAVPRASRRGCGAGCRRWCRWLSSWQAQYPEPPEGAAARVVAAGAAGCLPRGRRSTQSLLLYILLTLPAVVGMRPLDSFDGRFECVTF